MPDFTSLALTITVIMLSINGFLMIAPNPQTQSFGYNIDKSGLSFFLPSTITEYSSVSDFNGQNQLSVETGGLSSVQSGTDTGIPIIGTLFTWLNGGAKFIVNIFLGFSFALIQAGLPLPLVFAISVPLFAIQAYGVFFLFMMFLQALGGLRP